MKWSDVLDMWSNGKYLKYPKTIKKRFFYETYPCDFKLSNPYLSTFIESAQLEQIKSQDYTDFASYIVNSKSIGQYATSFINKSGSSKLIIPLPADGLNYATIKDFIDNAPKVQQTEFWKFVASEIKEVLKYNQMVWISTHGLGVSYFHLRIDLEPKYYQTKEFVI